MKILKNDQCAIVGAGNWSHLLKDPTCVGLYVSALIAGSVGIALVGGQNATQVGWSMFVIGTGILVGGEFIHIDGRLEEVDIAIVA